MSFASARFATSTMRIPPAVGAADDWIAQQYVGQPDADRLVMASEDHDDAYGLPTYLVRADNRVVEISSDEDWYLLWDALTSDAGRYDSMELWVTVAGQCSVRLIPPESIEDALLAVAKFSAAGVGAAMIESPPILSISHANPPASKQDDNYRYRAVMGLMPTPPGVDGPVIKAA